LDSLFYHACLVDWNAILDNDDIGVLWTKIHDCIMKLFELCIPSRMVPITNADKEWMTPITKMYIIDRWDAFRSKNWPLYNHLKLKVRKEIENAKRIWANRLMATSSGLWTLVNKHRGNKRNDVSAMISPVFPEKDVLERLTDHLANHFTAPRSSILKDDELTDDDWNIDISEFRVKKMFQRYPKRKACGSDNIPTRVYVELADILCKPLCYLYNQSCKQRKFPSAWKVGRMVAIPKSNPPALDKMRFITLLPVPAKILERVVYDQLRNHFEHSFGREQHGFRQNASTVTALLEIINAAAETYDDKLNFGLTILSFDLSSAFDCVEHARAIRRLNQLNFPRGFLKWLHSYLQNRTSVLKLIGMSSQPICIQKGVPQGSVLGPPIFCSFISQFARLHL
jgi:hypothetical protein